MWLHHKDLTIVMEDWGNLVPMSYVFLKHHASQRLRYVKKCLKVWISNHLISHLPKVSMDTQLFGITDELWGEEALLCLQLEKVLIHEELFWHQQTYDHWIFEGDHNTKYSQFVTY